MIARQTQMKLSTFICCEARKNSTTECAPTKWENVQAVKTSIELFSLAFMTEGKTPAKMNGEI
jgi:hypothetical protein